jgi:hypothetical protein
MCYSSKIAEEEHTEESAENGPAAVTVDKPATKAAPTVKRGRGRPKKASATNEVTEPTVTVKRNRGRPRKITVPQAEIETLAATSERVEEFVPELQVIEELDEHATNEELDLQQIEVREAALREIAHQSEPEQPNKSSEMGNENEPELHNVEEEPQLIIKRKRGRPKKSAQANKPPEQEISSEKAEEMRLRPRKQFKYQE